MTTREDDKPRKRKKGSATSFVSTHNNAQERQKAAGTMTYARHNAGGLCTSSWQLACIERSLALRGGVRIIPRDLRTFPIPICVAALMPPPPPPPQQVAPRITPARRNKERTPLNNFPFYSYKGERAQAWLYLFPVENRSAIRV